MDFISLFDGMGCLAIALKELRIPIDKYYSSEIDKFANIQTKKNFPDIIQLGDIENWREWDIDWSKIGLVGAGSPCQGFSFAGKQLAFDDPRSKLFFVFVEILNHIKKLNPDVKFLLENVQMKKEYLKIISEYVGLFPCNINSNLVSSQNRNRYYWSNIRVKKVGLFEELYTDIPQPEDRGILLKDILQPENEIDKKYYLSEKALLRMNKKEYSKPQIEPEKTGALNTKNNSGQCSFDSGTTLIKGIDINGKAPTQRSSTGRCLDNKHNYQIIKLNKQLKQKPDQNKASCFTAGGNSGGNHSDMDIICVAMRGRNPENPNDRRTGSPTEQRLEPKTDGKTNCLTSVAKDNLVYCLTPKRTEYGKKIRKDYESGKIKEHRKNISQLEPREDGKTNTISTVQKDNLIIQKSRGFNKGGEHIDKSPTLTGNSWENNNHLSNGYKLRRLTVIECARLQTVPEWYKFVISDSQAYKMLGNGWTIEVIKHILSFLNLNK